MIDVYPSVASADVDQASFFGGTQAGDEATIRFVLRARGLANAKMTALKLADDMRMRASLEDLQLQPADVRPLAASPKQPEHAQRFRDQAEELVEEERYELAVIASQIYFEAQTKLLLRWVAAAKGRTRAKQIWKPGARFASLNNPTSQAIVELLLDFDVATTPEWAEFQKHLKARNAIVHDGAVADQPAAERSLASTEAMWQALWRAANAVVDLTR